MTVSRREMLSLLLGAPLAAQACQRPKPAPVAGSIRGASMPVGHRLRDATVEHATGKPVRVPVVVVGAGPAGLSAAWRLERLGHRGFVVLDLEPGPGGTAAYGTDGVVPYPWGAHYVPFPGDKNRALATLLEELGATQRRAGRLEARETALVRAPEERLFYDGAWYQGLYPHPGASQRDLAELEKFQRLVDRWVQFRDARGRPAFTIPVRNCSDDAEVTTLDRITAAAWLEKHGFGSERLRWYVEYACRDDYGCTLQTTSAWAMLFYFCSRVAAPGSDSAPFLTWPEGNGRLVRHLAKVAGSRLKTGRLVTDVVPGPDQVEISALDVKSGSLTRYLAEHVILAIPRFVVPRVLRPWRDAAPDHVVAFSYAAWLVANLHLRQRPASRGFPFAWDNVLYDSNSLGYVVATHQRLADFGPTVWTYYQPLVDEPRQAREKLLALDHAAIADAVLADLERAHDGLGDALERIDGWRWGHAMVRPTPGFVWGAARKQAQKPLGRVHFAHSDMSGIPLFEEAQDHGVRAAEAVLRARGRAIESLGG